MRFNGILTISVQVFLSLALIFLLALPRGLALEICCAGQIIPEEDCCNDVVLAQGEVCCEEEPTPAEYCCDDVKLKVPEEQCCYNSPETVPYTSETQCCTDTAIYEKADLLPEDISKCPNRVARESHVSGDNRECGDDSSTWVPDSFGLLVDFSGCCIDHDHCYDTCNTGKLACDAALSSCMAGKCSSTIPVDLTPILMQSCLTQAAIYFGVLTVAGQSHAGYIEAQRQACQCCP